MHVDLLIFDVIDHARFINHYGDRHARLFRKQMVVPEKPASTVMKLVFLLLFDAPSTHLSTLDEFYVDKVIYSDGWRQFIEVLLRDWQDFILWVQVSQPMDSRYPAYHITGHRASGSQYELSGHL